LSAPCRHLDLPLALAAWLLGFGWLAIRGTFVPLALFALAAAARLVASDPGTRRLLTPTPVATAAGAAVGFVSLTATYVLYPAVADLWPELSTSVSGLYRILAGGPSGRWALVAVIASVGAAEEIVWRGRFLPGMPGAPGPALGRASLAAAARGAALYGVVHLASGSRILPLIAFACGLGWAVLRVATRSLWAPVVAHVTWSSAVLILRPLA
jgi:membrane protease YdiL (CAAX protease family)